MVFEINYLEVLWIQANRSQMYYRYPNKITINYVTFVLKKNARNATSVNITYG